MVFTATMASANPTWASCGVPATMSPTAHTPSTPVRWYSSVATKPRRSISTPSPSATNPSVRGRRPTDTTTASASNVWSPAFTVVVVPSSDGV